MIAYQDTGEVAQLLDKLSAISDSNSIAEMVLLIVLVMAIGGILWILLQFRRGKSGDNESDNKGMEAAAAMAEAFTSVVKTSKDTSTVLAQLSKAINDNAEENRKAYKELLVSIKSELSTAATDANTKWQEAQRGHDEITQAIETQSKEVKTMNDNMDTQTSTLDQLLKAVLRVEKMLGELSNQWNDDKVRIETGLENVESEINTIKTDVTKLTTETPKIEKPEGEEKQNAEPNE